jgi:histidinol dehydrogenase
MSGELLRTVEAAEVRRLAPRATDPATRADAARLVEEVRSGGEAALRRLAGELDGLAAGAPLVLGREELEAARRALPAEQRALLERTAERIRAFALAQRSALSEVSVPVPGGRAGHEVVPVERAGCYAPGGRFPLPSSVLMTAVTARAAGVREVWVASPRPAPVTLAAAAIAGADGLLAAGGAQAVAALALGVGTPPVDVVVGPGNRWVTAAKQLLYGQVGVDMLAGPSELVVLADEGADPGRVAADLIAQAEHDADALPVLISLDPALPARVQRELALQLEDLPTADTARIALERGFAVVARDADEAAALADRLAPEHLQLEVREPGPLRARLGHHGALFVGPGAGEVLGDYGAGPNHVLPTGGGGRARGGLSVLDFLRVRTWLELERPEELARDAAALARLEGLEGHARAAERRLAPSRVG